MLVGMLLVILGVLMLLDRLNIIPGGIWEHFWPLAIIAVGIYVITRSRGSRQP